MGFLLMLCPSYCFNFIVAVLLLRSPQVLAEYEEGTVYTDSQGTRFVKGKMDKSGAAYGFYNNTLSQTGWGILDIKAGQLSTNTLSNKQIMYAAGYLEGVFTAEQIWQHFVNMRPVFLANWDEKEVNALKNFFDQQTNWTQTMINKYGVTDPYWRHVSYIISHFNGLYAGYKSVAKPEWEADIFVISFLNAVGDLIDLQHYLNPSGRPAFETMSHDEMLNYVNSQGHCSALVKVTGAFENVFMSHSSWFVYAATMRIYKHYDFNVNDPATAARKMSFSSYPGFLESLDDFYLLGSQLVLLQTTNNVFNMSLYDKVSPQSLLAWQRVRLANMMATSGPQWYQTFKQFNSGTYNNQYMIIDLKKIELNKAIHDDALWVVEQIPGLVVGQDQSAILRTGYWPSYNVPFYESVYEASGYPAVVAKSGVDFSYQLAPRAKIFRRDQATVLNMKTMKNIMRYNDYKKDKYSEGNSCNSICCRGDLVKGSPRASGCYDTKVSDYNMAKNLQTFAINGPTRSHMLPPFSWKGPFSKTSHLGLPNVYDFNWIYTQPSV